MERFREKGCRDVECEACRWCHEFAAKAVRIDPEEARAKALAAYDEVFRSLDGGDDVAVPPRGERGRRPVNGRFALKARERPRRRPSGSGVYNETALRRGGAAVRPGDAHDVARAGRGLETGARRRPAGTSRPRRASISRAGPATWPFFSRDDTGTGSSRGSTSRRRCWRSPGAQPVSERPVRAGRPVRIPSVRGRFRRHRDRELRPSQRARPSERRRRDPPGAFARRRRRVPRLLPSGRSSLRNPQYLLLRSWCGPWGFLLHGTPEIHGYVAESLRSFPDRNRLREIFRENRFEVLTERRFFLGITGFVVLRPA